VQLEDLGTIATGLDHPEGVAWDPVGHRVIACDFGQGRSSASVQPARPRP